MMSSTLTNKAVGVNDVYVTLTMCTDFMYVFRDSFYKWLTGLNTQDPP